MDWFSSLRVWSSGLESALDRAYSGDHKKEEDKSLERASSNVPGMRFLGWSTAHACMNVL